jgi:hypothetical protein
MEKTLYSDKNITITNRKIILAEKNIGLATIRAVDIQQRKDPSNLNRYFINAGIWLLLCITAALIIPTGIVFFVGGFGLWWLTWRVWPYVIVVETQHGEEIVLSSSSKGYIDKIARILSDALGFELSKK